jgi:hypothetical protein
VLLYGLGSDLGCIEASLKALASATVPEGCKTTIHLVDPGRCDENGGGGP